jgi:hypothetical protein
MPRTAAAISVVMAMPCGVIPGAFQPGPVQTSVYFNLNFPQPAGDASGMVRFNYNPQWR